MKEKIYFLLVIIVLVLGCTKNEGLTGKIINKEPNNKIIFGVDEFTMASAPVFVAESKGFWGEEGLDVEITPFLSGRLALDALIGESVDAATVADIPVVFASFQQHNPRIIGTISNSEKHINLLARRDKGISKPQDIKGKKIAVSSGTSGYFVLSRFLEIYNISESDVKIINLNPPDMVAAVVRGDVDVIVTWQPYIYNAHKILENISIEYSSKGIYNQPFNVVVMEESIGRQGELQKKLLTGLKKAEKFMKENRKESIEIIAKKLGMDSQIVESLWDNYSFKVGIGPNLVNSLGNEGKWAKKVGIAKQDATEPDYNSLIYDELIGSLK